MFRRIVPVALCAVSLTGCTSMQPLSSMFGGFKPKPNDYRDFSEEYVSDEYSIVGTEGRGDQAREWADDNWFNKLKSKKHRDIEANLGFRH